LARDTIEQSGLVKRCVGVAIPPPRAIPGGLSTLYKARHFLYYNSFFDYVGGTKANNFQYLEDLYRRW
jgi:hypothetical protein